jgi:YidC/Oxa1 family membrane protein insertase
MEDQRRTLIAFAVVAAFLFVWYAVIAPPPKRPAQATEPAAASTASPVASAPKPTAEPAPKSAPKPAIEAAAPARKRSVSTDAAEWTFTTAGGVPAAARLKAYRTAIGAGASAVSVIPFSGGETPPLLWSFRVDGSELADAGATYAESTDPSGALVYERGAGHDLGLRKTYRWDPSGYLLAVSVELINRAGNPRKVDAETALASGTVGSREQTMMDPGDPLAAMAFVNGKTARLSLAALAKEETFPKGDVGWAGVDSRYFLLSMVPTEGRWSDVRGSAAKEDAGAKPETVREARVTAVYPTREIPAHGAIRYGLSLFAGPKDIGVLRSAGFELDHAIDLGDWLGPIARPMLLFLRWLYSLVPNYGVAILFLTVLVRLLMFPLTQMQAKSMRRMQEHKPQMDALKEKFKDNKEAYSRELMTYMRTHKINPMGGCLLLLPQLPVFFALYRVLYNSIELRHAPLGLWIRDLSAHDPYFVTPVLLGVVMFVQQRMTPMPGADPAQQTMMKIMPVMFSVFMLFLPAGLNLYILVSTLWGIGQQVWVQRGLAPQAVKTQKQGATHG